MSELTDRVRKSMGEQREVCVGILKTSAGLSQAMAETFVDAMCGYTMLQTALADREARDRAREVFDKVVSETGIFDQSKATFGEHTPKEGA